MKVLVTGANGFIGREIVAELFKKSHEIAAIGRAENFNSEFVKSENYFQADVSDYKTLTEAQKLKKLNTIIHCAGLAHQFGRVEKEDFWRVNVTGTKNVADLATNLNAEHFILISSVAVYGGNANGGEAVGEDFICAPKDFYAQSKLESERIAEEITAKNKIKLTILRPATVIGEGDRGNFLRLIRAIDRKRFVWIGNGANRKSLIHKTDVARACLAVLNKRTDETEIYNVAATPLMMREIVDIIADNLKTNILPFGIPIGLLRKIFDLNFKTFKQKKITKLAETIQKWTAEDVYSAEKLRKAYGFTAKVSVEEAIAREVEWYRSNNFSKK